MKRGRRRAFVSLLLAALFAWWCVKAAPVAAAEFESASPRGELQSVAEEMVIAESVGVQLAMVYRLRQLSRYVPQRWYREQVEEVRKSVDDPRVAFQLQREVWRLNRELGEGRAGSETVGSKGCLANWSVVGPFDNDNMQAFGSRLGPERGHTGPYEGKTLEVEWRRLPDFESGCVFRLGRTIHPSRSAVAYLAGTIESDDEREARLLVGAHSAYKVWVNGEQVAGERNNLGLQPDNQAWRVSLQKGKNRILVKLATRSSGSMDFVARLVEEDYAPIDVSAMEAAWSGEAVDESSRSSGAAETEGAEQQASEPEATGEGVSGVASSCATEAEGAEAAWCARLWRRAQSARAAAPWRDVAERLTKGVRDGSSEADVPEARTLIRVAKMLDNPATRLRVLRRAWKSASDDPWVGLALVRGYRSAPGRLDRRRVPKLLEEIRSNHPEFWPAALALASWYSGQGFGGRALKVVRNVEVDDRWQRPVLVRRISRLEEGSGVRKRARKARKRLAAIRASGGGWARSRFERLATTAKSERALEFVRERLRLQPLSTNWLLKRAELLRANGQPIEALAVLEASIAQKPGSVRLRRKKAELLVASHRPADAVATLEEATTIEPQNRRLEEYLASLREERRRFYEPWLIEDVRKYAERHEPGSYSDDTVLEQTVVRVSPNGLSKRVVQRVDRAITGDGVEAAANLSVSYTRGDERVEVIDVRVHKPDGRVLEDYDKWRSGRSKKSGPYYNDQRYLNIRANNVEKGDLVEYQYRVRKVANENFRGDYFGDISYLQGDEPVGFWRYAVEAPASWDLYFRAPELEHERIGPARPNAEKPPTDYRVHGFELEGVPAVKTDPNQPGHADVYDYLLVSNKETWNEVGTWWWNLIEEQFIVDEAIAETVDRVTDGLESDREKVEALHNYVVENTRYLHVGLGVHGWKPYRTTQCFQNKYGDCKDKASLLKVMLGEVGIESHMVLVRTRDLGTVADEPASMHVFNHAINYIPSMDLFLDPTAEFTGVGQLPSMDYGAQALVVEDGGETRLTTLPVDGADENLLVRELEVDLSKEPTVTRGTVVARGQHGVYYRRKLQNPDRRDEVFEKELTDLFPGAQLVSAKYEHLDDLQKPVEITFEFEGGRLERSSNDRRYVFPYGARKNLRERYASRAERNQDRRIRMPISNETTMRYRLGEGRRFDRVPESVELENEFGYFRLDARREGDTMVVEVKYAIETTRVPVERYGAFRSFLSKATSALSQSIRIVDDEGS